MRCVVTLNDPPGALAWSREAGVTAEVPRQTAARIVDRVTAMHVRRGGEGRRRTAVRPGDHFNASVTYTGSNRYSLFIQDTTQGWSHTHTGTLANAPRSSAEVIVEAPCCTASGGILPLADFNTVNITGSLANGSALGNAGGVTQIVMVNSAGQDKDTVSPLSGGENFSATWLRSN
jgi:hypothetical protein